MTSSGSGGGRPRVSAGPLTPRAQVQVYAGQFGPTGPPGPPNTLTAGPTTTGAPGSNASVVITGTAPNQTVAFTIPRGDVGPAGNPTQWDLRGTGSPEGAVSAPVGSIYTDTAATNGAIRWIKQTGTGATGWRVLWGDTGWRDLTALLINGWAASANGIRIRRSNERVTLDWGITLSQAAATADQALADIGVGWRAPRATSGVPIYATPAVVTRLTIFNAGAGPLIITRAGWTGTISAGQVSWFTEDAWPTTLP